MGNIDIHIFFYGRGNLPSGTWKPDERVVEVSVVKVSNKLNSDLNVLRLTCIMICSW